MGLVRVAAVLIAVLGSAGAPAVPESGVQGGQPHDVSQSLPPLPALPGGSYPSEAGLQIGNAAEDARAHPEDPRSVGTLAMTLHAWEQWDAARTAYARAAALAPAAFEWWYLQGIVLQRLARPAEAASSFEHVVALAPDYVPARLKLAEALLEAGDIDASARAYAAIADQADAAPAVALGLGRLAALAGRHEEAAAHFRRAIALYPRFGAAYYGLALSERALGHRDQALAALDKHRELGAEWPAIEDPVTARVLTLKDDPRDNLRRGLALAREGDVAGAIDVLEAAIARRPSLAQERANLITLYGRQGNWTKAEEHYRVLLSLGFNSDEAHYNYGVLLGMQQRWDEAAAAFKAAIAANPDHALARNNLGQLLEREGRAAEAAVEYRRAVESRPSFRLARFNMARLLVAERRFDAAISEMERILEPQDEETPRYLFGLAVAHVHAGHRERGLAIAGDALRLAQDYKQQDLASAIAVEIAKLK